MLSARPAHLRGKQRPRASASPLPTTTTVSRQRLEFISVVDNILGGVAGGGLTAGAGKTANVLLSPAEAKTAAHPQAQPQQPQPTLEQLQKLLEEAEAGQNPPSSRTISRELAASTPQHSDTTISLGLD